jgi:hypothetical protein
MKLMSNLASGSPLPQANVKFFVQQLIIICAHIQCDWQALDDYRQTFSHKNR